MKRRLDKKVIPLRALELAPRADVIALLEDMLERAKSGQVRGIAISVSTKGDCWGSAYKLGDGGIAHVIAGLVEVQARLLKNEVESLS
jgi:hypothetical protein